MEICHPKHFLIVISDFTKDIMEIFLLCLLNHTFYIWPLVWEGLIVILRLRSFPLSFLGSSKGYLPFDIFSHPRKRNFSLLFDFNHWWYSIKYPLDLHLIFKLDVYLVLISKIIYLYLSQNKLPTSKAGIRKVEMLAERYILLDSLLFRITSEKESAVLAVSETCADKIITLYHSSLFAGHQGVIKTYLTISNKFFIPNLIHYLRSYIKWCHIFQLAHNEKPPARQLQTRINRNYIPLSRWRMDLKVMARLHKGHKFILCIIDEVTI